MSERKHTTHIELARRAEKRRRRLIAAAPEMYAALRGLIEDEAVTCRVHGSAVVAPLDECDCWGCSWVRRANRALDKAEGRSDE